MSFLTPFMLWGALAAGIPVAIHLFFRSRYRTVPWAAMKFLLTSVEQTSRRLKFQELLLLLLRICVLVMLALAFARPISSTVRGAGRGDSVDAVFVFDLSFSMAANDGPKTRLERAKDEAIKIIDELPSHSTVQIVTCGGNAKTLLGPRSPADLEKAKQLIHELEVTHLATDLYVGVAEAQGVLARGQASNKELYVFSDMQKLGWDQQAGELKRTFQEIKEKSLINLVRCGNRQIKNAAIVGIVPQSGVPRPGDRVGFAVMVRNTGAEMLENLPVSLMVDGDEKNREPTTIPKLLKGETRAVTLNCKLPKAGLRVLTARVGADDLDGDNRFDQIVMVRDQINVLVVDGNDNTKDPEKASSYFLMHALLPVPEIARATYRLNPRVVPARFATPAHLNNQDICILVNVALQTRLGSPAAPPPVDFVEALGPFVRKGHGLIVFSGDNVQTEPYNKLLDKKLGLLPMPLKGILKAADLPAKASEVKGRDKAAGPLPMKIDRNTFGLPAYREFRDDKLYQPFSEIEVWKMVEVDEAATSDIQDLRYGFYRQTWRDLPDFSKYKADEEGKLPKGMFDLRARTRNQDFGFVFDGTLLVPESGKYTFDLDSADGARLTVGGEEVIAYDGQHEMGQGKTKTIDLTKGKHSIKLEYFQHVSQPGLSVGWSSPNFVRRSLSAGSVENPVTVALRVDNGKALVASKKVDAGEVIFIGTAAHHEGFDPETRNPSWTDFGIAAQFIPFVDVTVSHLMQAQTQTYNFVAGETIKWYPTEKVDHVYSLVHPDGRTVDRLGLPVKDGKSYVVSASDLPRAGVYHMASRPRVGAGSDSIETVDLIKTGTPIAVIPDLRESADLQTVSNAGINEKLGFEPIHITAGDASAPSTGADRLNREWTVWVLLAVLFLVLGEVVLAWWCGKAW